MSAFGGAAFRWSVESIVAELPLPMPSVTLAGVIASGEGRSESAPTPATPNASAIAATASRRTSNLTPLDLVGAADAIVLSPLSTRYRVEAVQNLRRSGRLSTCDNAFEAVQGH